MIIAFGLAFLETAANPYVSVLGPAESAGQRLNFSQSFNGLGWIFGPLVGGLIIFGLQDSGDNAFSSIAWPYLGVGVVVLLVALLFIRTPLPEIREEQTGSGNTSPAGSVSQLPARKSLGSHRGFVLAIIAQFFYVAAQTGINSFFINYTTESIDAVSNAQAAIILSFGGMGLFWAGRLSGSFLMRSYNPGKLLTLYAAICTLLMVTVIAGLGWISVTALFVTYFFMSIMFPTIFVLGLKGLGPLTKKASSYLVMAIVGGALCPMLMGYIADQSAMQWGFIVPLVCFLVVFFFGKTSVSG
jgi:FHS family L-fucose permease-like MFS transporter